MVQSFFPCFLWQCSLFGLCLILLHPRTFTSHSSVLYELQDDLFGFHVGRTVLVGHQVRVLLVGRTVKLLHRVLLVGRTVIELLVVHRVLVVGSTVIELVVGQKVVVVVEDVVLVEEVGSTVTDDDGVVVQIVVVATKFVDVTNAVPDAATNIPAIADTTSRLLILIGYLETFSRCPAFIAAFSRSQGAALSSHFRNIWGIFSNPSFYFYFLLSIYIHLSTDSIYILLLSWSIYREPSENTCPWNLGSVSDTVWEIQLLVPFLRPPAALILSPSSPISCPT